MTVRPTRRGVAVLCAAALCVVGGWLFGVPEATAVGVGAAVLVAGAAALVALGGPGPAVTRIARPGRLSVGERCDIELRAANVGSLPSPVTVVTDDIGGHDSARLRIAPLRPRERTRSTYAFPSHRRGVHLVGPLVRRVEDPFGLVGRTAIDRRTTVVVVVPRVLPLPFLPAAVGDEPELGTHSMAASSTVDEEFTGLRDYVAGDDLRRIHWPSTARAGVPMVRQFEVPWQHRTTVVMDLRASRHDAAAFERTVTVAASTIALAASGSELVRFATTSEPDLRFVAAADHLDELLDQLAAVVVSGPGIGDDDLLVRAVERATRFATGRLVVISGELGADEMHRVGEVASRAGLALVVTTGGHVPTGGTQPPTGPTTHLHWDGTTDIVEQWGQAAGQSRPPVGHTAR